MGSGGIETGYNGGTSSLQTTSGNIEFIGVSALGPGIALKSVFTVASTSGGNITLTGTSSGTNQNGIYLENDAKVLASGGTITLTGTGTGTGKDVNLALAGGVAPVIGYAASSVVPASTSNITINANTLSPAQQLPASKFRYLNHPTPHLDRYWCWRCRRYATTSINLFQHKFYRWLQ